MGYQHGIYISAVLSLGTEPLDHYRSEERSRCTDPDSYDRGDRLEGKLTPKVAFACVCKRFAESMMRIITHSKGALPSVRWYTSAGKRLPDDPWPLIEQIIVGRVGKVVIANLGYRNGYSGRIVDLHEFWDEWSASEVGPVARLWIARAVSRGVVERERRRQEAEVRRRKVKKSSASK